jgi:hypothetical protein
MKKVARKNGSSGVVSKSSNLSLPTDKNLKNFTGGDLLKTYPQIFDRRVSANQRSSLITNKQFKEYLGELECAVCGKAGGKCKCQPEDLIVEEE